MDTKKTLKKFYTRLTVEGWLKALLWGFIVGFAVNFVVALVTWVLKPEGLFLSLISFAVTTAIATPIFYFIKFKPTEKVVAHRADSLGLEERLVTQLELKDDDSFMARLQREDAAKAIKTVEAKHMKFIIKSALIVVCSCFAFVGVSMTTVTALSDFDVIPSGVDLIDPKTFIVEFATEGAGDVVGGDVVQEVSEGDDGLTVEAIPEDGWSFVGWFNENGKIVETDKFFTAKNVIQDCFYVAIFEEVGPELDDDALYEEGDKPDDIPERSGNDGDGNGEPNPDGSGAGGMVNTEGDMVVDNETNYEKIIGEYYEQAKEYLANGQEIPDYIRQIIEEYYDVIS